MELFGWPHAQIAKECPSIAAAGYLGVKVYPPQESVISFEPFNNVRLASRSIPPNGGQIDFARPPARVPHGAYVW